jgi:hypothetical protein
MIEEKRKLRNITDYIWDSTSRLLEHAELLLYLGKHKDAFVDETSKNSTTFILSIFDVYSRDAIIILGNILDEDRQTSSLFTLVDYIKEKKKKSRYTNRLKSIKKAINPLIRARGNQVAHFNTKLNIYEKGHMQINRIFQLDPRYLKKITKRIEGLLGDVRDELGVEGLFMFVKGEPIVKSFARLVRKGI